METANDRRFSAIDTNPGCSGKPTESGVDNYQVGHYCGSNPATPNWLCQVCKQNARRDAHVASVPGSPFTPPMNADLTGFAVHPAGKFLYASTGPAANGILAWSIDGTTGALTVLPASPFAAGTRPNGVVIDPLGKFLYASNGGGGGISGFTVDGASGALTPMSGSPFDASVGFASCVSDPLGRLVVAVDGLHDTITVFAIDPTTGALTQLGNPTSVSAFPVSLTIVKAP
jgi:6-phosphogluconolactonase (cycloisomerase 2 family)